MSDAESHRTFSAPFYADLRVALQTIISRRAAAYASGASENGLYHFAMPFFINEVGPGNCYCGQADEPFRHDYRTCPRPETHPLVSLHEGSVLLVRCEHEPSGRQQLVRHKPENCFDPADEINRFLYWFLAYRAGGPSPRITAEEEQNVHRAVTRHVLAERGYFGGAVYPPIGYIEALRMLIYQFIDPKESQRGHPIWKNVWKTHVVLEWEGKPFDEILDELIDEMAIVQRARLAVRRRRRRRQRRTVTFAPAPEGSQRLVDNEDSGDDDVEMADAPGEAAQH